MTFERMNKIQTRAFTVVELVAVVSIVGIVAAFAIPNLTKTIRNAYENAASDSLASIYSAQETSNNAGAGYQTAANIAEINTRLHMNITPNGINYSCAATASGFRCTATRTDNSFSLQISSSSNGVCCPVGPACQTVSVTCDAAVPVCGNGKCNSGEGESPVSCPADCGAVVCIPDCSAAVACGDPDGCGGLCDGACTGGNAGKPCSNGVCCTPTCAMNAACGDSNGCGGLCQGTCAGGVPCTNGRCCTPNCNGSSCGDPDGCGGFCLNETCGPLAAQGQNPAQMDCDTATHRCVCVPICPSPTGNCGDDNGCGGRCSVGSCAFFDPTLKCNATGYCTCGGGGGGYHGGCGGGSLACCDDVCDDTKYSSNNCGGCGTTCGGTVCCNNVCCPEGFTCETINGYEDCHDPNEP